MNQLPKTITKIPWGRLIIWGSFLSTLYILRHFFLVIFLTFIVSYSMRSLVDWVMIRFFPRFQKRWLEIVLTIICFLGLLGGLYGVGAYLIPELTRQGQEFVRKVANPKKSPKAQFDEFLTNSIGRWLFSQKYYDYNSNEFKEAFKNAQVSDKAVFERQERERLVKDWRQGEIANKIESMLEENVMSGMSKFGATLGQLIPKFLYLPFEIALSLLLSFFIVIDIPKMKNGLARLRNSRFKHIYDEIAPGLVNFGRLMGRAFQAQGIIALFNTALTYLLCIKILGLQHGVFLSSLVFLCSFIPVVGVVISGLPITIVALVQEDGGLTTAFIAIGMILLVHFIETSLLNPRILGNMLHLHPVLVLTILAVSEHFFKVWGLLLGVPVAVYIIRVVILNEGIPGLIEFDAPKRASSKVT